MSTKSRTQRSKTVSPEFRVVSRVLPVPFVNSKGFRIGSYHVIVNKDNLPFNSIDEANHFLYNLFDYAAYQGMPKSDKTKRRSINSFFANKQTDLTAFTPIKYPDEEQQKILEMEQALLREENKRLRDNLRTLQNKIAEITGDVGDPELRSKLKDLIKQKISEEVRTITTEQEKVKKEQQVLAESLNAIGELEDRVESFRPLYQKAKGGKKVSSKFPLDFILVYKIPKKTKTSFKHKKKHNKNRKTYKNKTRKNYKLK